MPKTLHAGGPLPTRKAVSHLAAIGVAFPAIPARAVPIISISASPQASPIVESPAGAASSSYGATNPPPSRFASATLFRKFGQSGAPPAQDPGFRIFWHEGCTGDLRQGG